MAIFFLIGFIVLSIWGFAVNGLAFTLGAVLLAVVMFMAWSFLNDSIEDSQKKSRESLMTSAELSEVRAKEAEDQRNRNALATARDEQNRIGLLSPKMKCPHCDTKGQVYMKKDAKERETTQSSHLTVAVLQGQKITTKAVTQLHCKNCSATWNI